MVVPQDDCSPYGFSAITQRKLASLVVEYELWDRVYIYPGADEVGCTLIARAVNKLKAYKPKVFIRYNSNTGCNTVPLYEDRPLSESIKSQICAAGGVIVHSEQFILFVNGPSNIMKEAAYAEISKDNSYDTNRNLREMIVALEYYIDKKIPCAIADVAYANGADGDLVKMLSNKRLYTKLYGYAAWNTCGNTLGTVISHSMIAVMEKSLESPLHQKFLLERFLEDWGYQSILRKDFAQNVIPKLGLDYFHLKDMQEKISQMLENRFNEIYSTRFDDFKQKNLEISKIYMPWNRMFEVGLEVKVRE